MTKFHRLDQFKHLNLHLRHVLREAKRRGYAIKTVKGKTPDMKRVTTISDGRKTMTVIGTNHYPDLSHRATYLTKHKFLAFEFLRKRVDILTPKTYLFYNASEADNYWRKKFQKKPIVLKPENAGMGVNVFVGLKTKTEVTAAAKKIVNNHDGSGLIQQYLKGEDLRLQAVGGKLFASATRIPANVVGDGKLSVGQLIEEKNKERKKHDPKCIIKNDSETKKLLKEQGLNLDSIPKECQKVRLKMASNIGLGGDPVEVKDRLDKSYFKIVEKMAEILEVKTFGLDFMVKDIEAPLNSAGNYLIEINAPCQWAPYYYAIGPRRDVAAGILDAYFSPKKFNPESKKYIIGQGN